MVFEIGSLKNFAIFTRKYLCWDLFLIKLQAFRLAIFWKETPTQVFSVEILQSFWEQLLWLLLTVLPQYCRVTWGASSLISPLTYFRFWSKPYTKRFTNNYLLSRDKSISYLIESIYHVLSVPEYVLEKH